jgi:hypothetical protein
MTPVTIPAWTAAGVIPPVSSVGPSSAERSPYLVSLSEFVLRFGLSPRRKQILNGFLQYRNRFHSAGVTEGFQWLDGSFLENIELTESRDPNDLDVVTFYSLPTGVTQQQMLSLAPDLFPSSAIGRASLKTSYFVDAYEVSLRLRTSSLIQQSTYWYSMWSHRRDQSWKGYLQIDLDPGEDALAASHLRAGVSP